MSLWLGGGCRHLARPTTALDAIPAVGLVNRSRLVVRVERPARLKLDRVEAAHTLKDLAALPGNRFEALKGYRKGQYSIRINDQWRICFQWPEKSSGPTNVEIVDYH